MWLSDSRGMYRRVKEKTAADGGMKTTGPEGKPPGEDAPAPERPQPEQRAQEEIEKVHELKADSLKLIAYGKVLEDDAKSAGDYNIKENDFIVAMVQKAKPAPKPKKEDEKKEDPVPAASTASTNPVPAAQPQPAAQP